MLIQPPERLAPEGGCNFKLSLATGAHVHIRLAAVATGAALCLRLTLRCRCRPARKNCGGETTAWREFTAYDAPLRLHGGNDVAQDLVYGVLVKDAQVAICEQIHF